MKKQLLYVTGHSQGLGKAILEHYLENSTTELIGISRKKIGYSDSRVKEISLDLGDIEAVESIAKDLFNIKGYDEVILINNAGWIGEIKSIADQSPQSLEKAVKVNLLAPILLMNSFLKAFKGSEVKKLICNISSGLAHRAESGLSAYCSTKSGLAMFTEVAAMENHANSRFFSLAPGIVDTPMQDDLRNTNAKEFPKSDTFKGLKKNGMLSSPEEVAVKVKFLLDYPDRFTEVVQDVRKFEVD